jgi:TonB family protein
MTTWWMAYTALVGVPLVAASWLMARSLRRHNRDERRVWLLGLALSVVLPTALLTWRIGAARSGVPVAAFVMELPGLEVAPRPGTSGQAMSLGSLVLFGWALASGLMAIWLIVSLTAVQRLRSASARRTVRGRSVRVSTGAGPAVVGFLRPEILVPSWVLDLEGGDAEWILRHEEEHVRARDPLLLLVAHLARVVVPWHPGIWFLTSRLVRAIEIDCDRRVLRAHPDPVAYGHTLVRALARGPRPIRAAAAFSLHTYDLEERIATMTRAQSRFGPIGWITAAAALVLVAGACGIPVPTNADDDDRIATPEAAADVESAPGESAPRFTPYTVAPNPINRAEVAEALRRAYPEELRQAGIGGTARVWFFIGTDGKVLERRLDGSSGNAALDQAALDVARIMEFSPALNRDQAAEVWVAFPITFAPAPPAFGAPEPPITAHPRAETQSAPAPDGRVADPSGFTPFTDPPVIQNRAEISERLEAEYPPLLRDAGIGGTARVWLFIGRDGSTRDVRLDGSSGHASLDEAALRVALKVRFAPARNGENPVDAWIAFPITFMVR